MNDKLYTPRMKSPSVWAFQPDLFEYRFNRKCKERTIEDVHALWLKVCERTEKRKAVSRKLYDRIVKEMAPTPKANFKIYQDDPEVDYTYEYSFRWSDGWDGYGVSSNIVKFSEDVKKAREEKIDFLIANEEAYKWGELYSQDQKTRPKFHFIVMNVLFKMIESKLREKFKNSEVRPNPIFKIAISDKQYYIMTSGDGLHFKNNYVKFEFGGEVVEDSEIKLEGKHREIW